MENVLEIMPRYAPEKPPGPPCDANTSYDRSFILCAGTSTTCSATHPVPHSCGTTYTTSRLVHQPETQGHLKFAHRCAALCAPAARTGSNPTFHSEPEIRAHAQFGKRYNLVPALSWKVQLLTAPTHIKTLYVKNTTRSRTDVVIVREGLSPVSYLSRSCVFAALSLSLSLSVRVWLRCLLLSLTLRACLLPFSLSCVSVCLPPYSLSCVCLPPPFLALASSGVGVCCSFVGLASSRVGVFCFFCWPCPFPCGCVCFSSISSFRECLRPFPPTLIVCLLPSSLLASACLLLLLLSLACVFASPLLSLSCVFTSPSPSLS